MDSTPSSTVPTGKTTIAPEVLLTIARLSALSVTGVNRLSTTAGDVNQIFTHKGNEGVSIKVDDGVVYADIYVVLNRDVNVRDVARSIQNQVSRAISEMVGMEVGKVNIHVEDIEYNLPAES